MERLYKSTTCNGVKSFLGTGVSIDLYSGNASLPCPISAARSAPPPAEKLFDGGINSCPAVASFARLKTNSDVAKTPSVMRLAAKNGTICRV